MECLVNETPRDRWSRLSDTALAPMQQRWSYGDAAGALGSKVLRMELRIEGRTLALAQVLQRRFLVPVSLISRGPVWTGTPSEEHRSCAIRLLRRMLTGPVLITPPDCSDGTYLERLGMTHAKPPSTLGILPIDDGTRARMHGKWRNRLAAAERSGLTITESTNPLDMHWLLQADALQQKSRRYRALPPAFTARWHGAGGSLVCITATKDSERLAAMLFLVHGTTATYHVGWTGDAGRAMSAHNLILWNACAYLAAQGVLQLDLGLINSDTAPGLARFKLGTGAEPVRTGETWLSLW